MHDDQHGTAIVILAALINSAKVVGKSIEDLKVVVNGAGAAGYAITKLLLCLGIDKKICTSVKEIIVCDSRGAIHEGRADLNPYKRELAQYTNALKHEGTLGEVIKDADVFIGVSTGNVLTKEMIMRMNRDPIVFAMANPTPEIAPEQAKGAAAIFGTGRSDYPNQINNSLAFPGVFRGALDSRARLINNEMKIAAAEAIAFYIKNPTKDNILPSTLDKGVAKTVAEAVKKAAIESGVA
jgi:malate dehydrogenase (oxaloacetate-decarboxylating)